MRSNSTPVFLIAAAALVSPATAADSGPPPRDVLFNCPDPAIIQPREGGPVYVFSTGRGVPIFRSDDLFHWKSMGRVFGRGEPAWARQAVPGAGGFWAPDIRWFDGRYYLYYAVSTFGSQRSVIGMAVDKTLDPASPDYRWEDRGLVVESSPGKCDFNAIDPAMFVDRDNRPYLFWGSFWSGIKAAKLDSATGKLPRGNPAITSVATRARGVEPPAIEAPYVLYHDGNYYLFVSWDSCCDQERSSYKVVVGRSKSVLGPYRDFDGRPMSEGGGTLVLASYGKWRGPGHNSALSTSQGDWLVLAGYDAENLDLGRVLQVRRMYWPNDGWPVAGEALTTPVKFDRRKSAPTAAAGSWKLWIDFAAKGSITLAADGTITAGGQGTWRQKDDALVLDWKDQSPQTLILEADGRCFVGRSAKGRVLFGQRIGP